MTQFVTGLTCGVIVGTIGTLNDWPFTPTLVVAFLVAAGVIMLLDSLSDGTRDG